MKKRLVTLILSAVMVLSLTISANAAWSRSYVLDIPGGNASKDTLTEYGPESGYAVKSTDEGKCTFETFENQAWGLFGVDGRLINSEYTPRSSWVRNMHTGSVLHAATTAVKNYKYWAELSTDLLEPSTISVSFRFSPDYED